MVSFQTEEAKWAWLAAIIDGEGTFVFNGKWHPRIDISNTSKELLEAVREVLMIKKVIELNRPSGHGRFGNKPQYRIKLSTRLLRVILPKIIPYLIAKKRQGEVFLEILNLMSRWNLIVKEKGVDYYRKRCEELKLLVHDLNKG
ncbi:MAG: LAGLIDADG family homing endonuclease [Thermoproteota archaeon]